MDVQKTTINALRILSAEAIEKARGEYGRFSEAVKTIDPRRE